MKIISQNLLETLKKRTENIMLVDTRDRHTPTINQPDNSAGAQAVTHFNLYIFLVIIKYYGNVISEHCKN
jgi:hypothetical protein